MKISDVDILLCADSRVLSREHWVERWSRNLKTGRLVNIGPLAQIAEAAERISPVIAAVECSARPVILVGYHTGVEAIVRVASSLASSTVKGMLFVAPPDLTLHSADDLAAGAISNAPMPCPSLLVASRSDPRCSFAKASDLALAWGSHLVDAGEAGQIDPSSGHGPWPEGLMRFGWFLKRL